MQMRIKVSIKAVFAVALALLLVSCLVHGLQIPHPSDEKLRQLRSCAAELEKTEFILAYPDWEKGIVSTEKEQLETHEKYEELCDIKRIIRHRNGIFFLRDSNIFTGARGYLVCDIPEPEFYNYEDAERIAGNVYFLIEGWD